jgi:TPR repeat protein
MIMTRYHALITAPTGASVAATASARITSSFWNMRGWLTALLIVGAMLATTPRVALADTEIILPGHNNAAPPMEAGIAAAKAGRIRDAITILTPHADNGQVSANYVLGLIYLRDRGALAARPTLSHSHFARAAAAGHVASIFEAAFQFERGIGTDRDMQRAIQLYQIAAKANHLNAQFNLATLLAHKEAGHKNLQQAYFWAIAARNNAVRTGDNRLDEARIARLVRVIRSRIPHATAAKASSAAARLTGQPV